MTAEPSVIAALRHSIARIEDSSRPHGWLAFGIPEIDSALPGHGLAWGALHEVASGGNGAIHGAAAQFFAASIAARTGGHVLWCYTRRDLLSPALYQVGLKPNRLTYFEAGDEKSVLGCFEEALRHGGLTCVVAELSRLSMTDSPDQSFCHLQGDRQPTGHANPAGPSAPTSALSTARTRPRSC